MKHLKPGRDRAYVAYWPLNDQDKTTAQYERKDFTHIKIQVTYTLGGINYMSGSTNARGYKVMTQPVTISEGTYRSESCTLLGSRKESGGYVMMEAANRFNAGRLAQLAELIDPKIPDIYSAVIRDDVPGLVALIQGQKQPATAEAITV